MFGCAAKTARGGRARQMLRPRRSARNATGVDGERVWASTFEAWLPLLALVAPLSLFLSALVRASGAGTLPGELFWISVYEAPIAGVGAAFYPATFIHMGKTIGSR